MLSYNGGSPHDDSHAFHKLVPMSKTLELLCKDEVGITKFRRLLDRVAIKEDGLSGDIAYWTTAKHTHPKEPGDDPSRTQLLRSRHTCTDTVTDFYLDGDEGLKFRRMDTAISLPVLPTRLLHKIFDNFMFDDVTINMDSIVDLTAIAPPLYVSQALRRFYMDHGPNQSYIIKMSSASGAQALCPNTSKLGKLLDTAIGHVPWGQATQRRFGINANLRLLLESKLDTPLQLDEARIRIVPFILASSSTWNTREVTLTFDAPDSEHQEVTMTLGLLRRRVLKALKAYRGEHPYHGDSELCPEIWVNGRGQVKEVVRKELVPSEASNRDSGTVDILNSKDENQDAASGAQPAFPADGQLGITIQYLAWVIRSWQKVA